VKSWSQSQIERSLNGQSALVPTHIKKNPSSSYLDCVENIGLAGLAFCHKSLQDCVPLTDTVQTTNICRKSFNNASFVNETSASKLDHMNHGAKVASLSTGNKGRSSVG